MSKISVADAREFAALLTSGASQAETAGETEFDLAKLAEGRYQQARDELQSAINAAKSTDG
jgi:hypothetical protein